ncbi:hypothetical protein BD413DRAFT_251102 [Trametes elegans]|nr:hypothetical protein BD413DRAFT_251102 [Trametes elegans]
MADTIRCVHRKSEILSTEYDASGSVEAEIEPRVPQPGERLDLYHETFPRDVVPPLMAAVVLGTKPPFYMLGWRYKYREFRKRFNSGRYDDPSIIFRQNVLPRFAEQYPEFEEANPRPRPMIYVDRSLRHCTVMAGSNAFEGPKTSRGTTNS